MVICCQPFYPCFLVPAPFLLFYIVAGPLWEAIDHERLSKFPYHFYLEGLNLFCFVCHLSTSIVAEALAHLQFAEELLASTAVLVQAQVSV